MLSVTDSNFDSEVLKSAEPVLIDFWAPWCGPCKVMGPIIEALAEEYKGKPMKFGKMNVDENEKTPSQYGVMSIPTFIVFKNGKPLDQFIGAQSKEEFKKKVEGAMK